MKLRELAKRIQEIQDSRAGADELDVVAESPSYGKFNLTGDIMVRKDPPAVMVDLKLIK